jgi:hypothetical protein
VKKYRHYENILEPSAEAVAEIDAYSSPAVSRYVPGREP